MVDQSSLKGQGLKSKNNQEATQTVIQAKCPNFLVITWMLACQCSRRPMTVKDLRVLKKWEKILFSTHARCSCAKNLNFLAVSQMQKRWMKIAMETINLIIKPVTDSQK